MARNDFESNGGRLLAAMTRPSVPGVSGER
jgi:hypothetical protein